MKTKRVFLLGFAVLILAGALWVFFKSPSDNPVQTTPRLEEGTYARAEGFSYTRNTDGRVEWEIKAKQADYLESRQIAEFKMVEAVFYDKNNQTVRLNGKTGRYFVDTQDIEVGGDVRIVTSMGYTLTTETLKYTQADQTIRSASQAFVHGEGVAMSCDQVVLAVPDEKLELIGDVKGTLWNPEMIEKLKGRIQ
jgi:LPS export ABC transporter protein LptC